MSSARYPSSRRKRSNPTPLNRLDQPVEKRATTDLDESLRPIGGQGASRAPLPPATMTACLGRSFAFASRSGSRAIVDQEGGDDVAGDDMSRLGEAVFVRLRPNPEALIHRME